MVAEESAGGAPALAAAVRETVPLRETASPRGSSRPGLAVAYPVPELELLPGRPSVSVVIPALNEAPSLPWVLEQIPSWVSQVVLVDGLSTDDTEVIARGVRADVTVIHQPRRGKGAALRAGFAAATGEVIVMVDADASIDPGEMERFVDALCDGAEFVKGSRHLAGGGSDDYSLLRRLGNRGFVGLVNLFYGSRFTDLCYGYCAFWRRHLDDLALGADGFEIETELVLRAIGAGLEIREVPSFELPRRYGKSNLNAFADGRRVLRTILDERPGRRSARRASNPGPRLVAVELPAPGSPGWMPAGQDRRQLDRRRESHTPGGYIGPERRRRERRNRPSETVVVYRALPDSDDHTLGRAPRTTIRLRTVGPEGGGAAVARLDQDGGAIGSASSAV